MLVDFDLLMDDLMEKLGSGSVRPISSDFTRQIVDEQLSHVLLLLKLYDRHLEAALAERFRGSVS